MDPPPVVDLDEALDRGVAFLLARQNPNGSWGSARRTKGLNIYAPVPGAHHAFRSAVTALCISALMETGEEREGVTKALDRAEAWLMKELPRVRRAEMEAIYNVWAHAYAIQALVHMLDRAGEDASRRGAIRKLMESQVEMLRRYEFVGGGWGYYDFKHHTQRPGGDPNSFTTATVLIAFHEARRAGVDVPQKLVQRGLREVVRQANPNFTYAYSRSWQLRPQGGINQPGGSLGRSQACNAARLLWGDERITEKVLATWLDRLFARNGWLSMGRKRPVPHESWYAVAGYFYYYGHYYAGYCMDAIPLERRGFYQAHMAHTLMALQEADGSWWDYPFYDYHQPYGTAFALMTLNRCRIESTVVAEARDAATAP